MEQEILKLYFKEKLKQNEIAKKLNISKYKVSRTVTNDDRYISEKEKRKKDSKKKHNKQIQKCVEAKRKNLQFKQNVDDLVLREMHNQAALELSKNSKLSDMAYRDWNTSAYAYNKNKKRFEFRDELGRSYAVKKYLKGII